VLTLPGAMYRMLTHDPEAFAGFYDVTEVPFRELM